MKSAENNPINKGPKCILLVPHSLSHTDRHTPGQNVVRREFTCLGTGVTLPYGDSPRYWWRPSFRMPRLARQRATRTRIEQKRPRPLSLASDGRKTKSKPPAFVGSRRVAIRARALFCRALFGNLYEYVYQHRGMIMIIELATLLEQRSLSGGTCARAPRASLLGVASWCMSRSIMTGLY